MLVHTLIAASIVTFVLAVDDGSRSKRQFMELDSALDELSGMPSFGHYRALQRIQPSIVYRYSGSGKWSPTADPYFSGLVSPYYQPFPVVDRIIERPPVYRKYDHVEYVPTRRLFRAKQIVLERPVTTVIERPARILTPGANNFIIEFDKKRKMARQ